MKYDKKIAASINGQTKMVKALFIDNKTIIITGKILRVANIKDEICDEGVGNPEKIIEGIKKEKEADVFTFEQKLPDTKAKYNYYHEWDNQAVLKIIDYDDWWKNKINNDARRMVRKSKKKNVEVKVVPFTDDLMDGLKIIYDESPIRQGKPSWHYKDTIKKIRKDNSSFLDRSLYIGAFYKDELIGYEKLIFTGERADPIQLISTLKDRDKAPTNALIAKSVEVCAEKKIKYLTYGKYSYSKKKNDSLSKFKKRNGFQQIDIPRYYVPITLKGKLAIRLKLHRGFIGILPSFLITILLDLRKRYYIRRLYNTKK